MYTDEILKKINPKILDGEYIFCSFKNSVYGDHLHLMPIFSFQEDEGLTLIILKEHADKNKIQYDNTFKCISLGFNSSLTSVGLTAALSSKLAKSGVSANMAAGYFHDHIFVPSKSSEKAMKILL